MTRKKPKPDTLTEAIEVFGIGLADFNIAVAAVNKRLDTCKTKGQRTHTLRLLYALAFGRGLGKGQREARSLLDGELAEWQGGSHRG